MLIIYTAPVHPMMRRRAVRVRSFLVKAGFLLLWCGDRGQQSASLSLVFLQECLRLLLWQLDVLQLL